ncbi:hypothetical protein KCG44_04100 [Pacificimonas sp. WHA3]|uniref:DUF1579 domain-containing protein n=1 Tax=Pacificimonas pallii TaxID=2827236 RepID=A0ABS6SCY0_9SPHN|nr:hypothetical protein [Pacificimonas pallii]MBV7255963.1 hypothetical protein [Pacificimonas pallii]
MELEIDMKLNHMLLGLTLILSGAAHAQQMEDAPAPPTPPGCTSLEGADEFDFFIGDWNVFNAKQQYVGRNVISKAYDGCFLFERWSGGRGGMDDGRSTSYKDPRDGKWVQLWASPNTVIDWKGGLVEPGKMRLEGEIVFFAPGRSSAHAFRGDLTKNADGTLTQFLEWQATEGEWSVWFDGTYVANE